MRQDANNAGGAKDGAALGRQGFDAVVWCREPRMVPGVSDFAPAAG
jgi:hypothetical protein